MEKEEFDLFGNVVIKDVVLRERFIEPPFSVLDTKSGNWQKRKKIWSTKGIKSELGRDSASLHINIEAYREGKNEDANYTSIFDPALTELMYSWFCDKGGNVLDPFAGGSVRGIVANYLGYKYHGIELREEQVEANRQNALEVLEIDNQPNWYCGDSDEVLNDSFAFDFDFIFSCPPYMDLEVYSDDQNDLSNMNDENFIIKYESIIKKSCDKLKIGGYACFVVGDVRDKKSGMYKDLPTITKLAFYKSGMKLYNDMVLLNSIASASMRADKQFTVSKKVVKVHQNVLLFKKVK